jgi:hypothetical protein
MNPNTYVIEQRRAWLLSHAGDPASLDQPEDSLGVPLAGGIAGHDGSAQDIDSVE